MEKQRVKILIVDDERSIRDFLECFLRYAYEKVSEVDLSIFFASNGVEALEVLETQVVNLVLTDYEMPKMNGKELVAKIKQLYPEMIVILISADKHVEKGEADFFRCKLPSMSCLPQQTMILSGVFRSFESLGIKPCTQKLFS